MKSRFRIDSQLYSKMWLQLMSESVKSLSISKKYLGGLVVEIAFGNTIQSDQLTFTFNWLLLGNDIPSS